MPDECDLPRHDQVGAVSYEGAVGRSEGRRSLRDFFEVDARHVAAATLSAVHRAGGIDAKTVEKAFKELEIDPDKADPASS